MKDKINMFALTTFIQYCSKGTSQCQRQKKKKKKVIKIENNKVKLDSRHRKQTYGYQRG